MKPPPDYQPGETRTQWLEPFEFAVRFAFGAPVGLLLGFLFWRGCSDLWAPGWLCLGGGALVAGGLAGCFGDRFWPWVLGAIRFLGP